MSNEVVKVQIANRLLDEYGKDIQSQCMGGVLHDHQRQKYRWRGY